MWLTGWFDCWLVSFLLVGLVISLGFLGLLVGRLVGLFVCWLFSFFLLVFLFSFWLVCGLVWGGWFVDSAFSWLFLLVYLFPQNLDGGRFNTQNRPP